MLFALNYYQRNYCCSLSIHVVHRLLLEINVATHVEIDKEITVEINKRNY
jgi:hypothetical protein